MFDLKKSIITPKLWNKEIIQENTQDLCYDYNDYLNNNEALKSVLKSLATFGIAIINNVYVNDFLNSKSISPFINLYMFVM